MLNPDQTKDALKDAKQGKACGPDGLSMEHFIHADSSIFVYMSLSFNNACNHMAIHMPVIFMKSVIVALIKNKNGDSSDKGNYKHIALLTACSI